MNDRAATAALAALLLLSACKVELTPTEFFDHGGGVREEGAAVAEVRDRVLAMSQALSRGTVADALSALAPARDAYIIGPSTAPDGGPNQPAGAHLEELAGKVRPLEPDEVVLRLGPTGNVAWFHTRLLPQVGTELAGIRFTGVYLLREGVWELVQAHLSDLPDAGSATADSARAGAYPAQAGTPGGGE